MSIFGYFCSRKETKKIMELIHFILLLSFVALCALGLALYAHRRKLDKRRYFTDPKRDHVYRHYNRNGKAIKEKTQSHQRFEF